MMRAAVLSLAVWPAAAGATGGVAPVAGFGPYCDPETGQEVFTLTTEGLFEPPQTLCRFRAPLTEDLTYEGEVACETPLFMDPAAPNTPSDIILSGYRLSLRPGEEAGTLIYRHDDAAPVETLHCHAVWPN